MPLDADVPVPTIRTAKATSWPSAAPSVWAESLQSLNRLWTEHALMLMAPEMGLY
jgi:predicted transcriptional regulator